ncbi:MAG TPA: hypothetical protein VLN59_18045, partial [Burkholderiales bacterium]|nr:hypothetical protein [Burkholderiales bacterium]
METQQTLAILNALANGVHPATGEQFPADSPYQHPDTVRALFAAMRAMESPQAAASEHTRKPAAPAGGNIGLRWTAEEEQRLVQAFDAGTSVGELARAHARSPAPIEARLLKLGKIDASQLSAPLRYGPKPNGGTRAAT